MNTSYPESESAAAGHPGDALRAARAARGWTQSDVALQIHLTVDAVNQVETGQFDKLPGLTFARGYVRAYAKLLGLDQNQLVHEFDAYTGSNATASDVQNLGRVKEPTRSVAEHAARRRGRRAGHRSRHRRPAGGRNARCEPAA